MGPSAPRITEVWQPGSEWRPGGIPRGAGVGALRAGIGGNAPWFLGEVKPSAVVNPFSFTVAI
jgi:hypothetical protein